MDGSSPSETDPNFADVQRRMSALIKSNPHAVPLRTEQEAASSIAQRQEQLSAGDPYEFDPAPQQPSRMPIGAIVGGMLGTIGGAPAGLPGAIGLGAVGAGGGEALQQLYEQATGSPFAPKTMKDAGKQIGEEMGFGAMGELGGRVVGQGIKKIVQRPVTANAEQVQALVGAGLPFQGKEMLQKGTPLRELFLTPSEQTGGQNYIHTLQNVAEGSFGGKSMIEEFKTNRGTFLRDGMQSFTDTLAKQMSPGELGDLLSNEIKGNFQAAKAPARATYNFLTEQTMPKMKPVYAMQPSGVVLPNGAPHMVKVDTGRITYDTRTGAWVDLTGIKKSLETDKKVADMLKGLGGKEGGDDIVTTTLSYADKVPYFVAQKLRSRLQSMADVFSVENKSAPALGIIKNMAGHVDKEIETGLTKFSPDASDLWRYANQTYRGANEDFNNTFLRSVLRNTDRKDIPEVVLSTILQPQKYSDVSKLKTAVSPDTWAHVQRSAFERIAIVSSPDNVLNPHKFEQALYGVGGLGKEKMEVLFDPTQQKWIKEFIQVAHSTVSKANDATGKMAIQLAQPGQMIAGAAFAGSFLINAPVSLPTTAAAVLLGPPALARIMTHPDLAQMFVRAMKTPAKSPSAGAIVGRLFSAMMPRPDDASHSSRGTDRMQPSTQLEQDGGLNLP